MKGEVIKESMLFASLLHGSSTTDEDLYMRVFQVTNRADSRLVFTSQAKIHAILREPCLSVQYRGLCRSQKIYVGVLGWTCQYLEEDLDVCMTRFHEKALDCRDQVVASMI